MLASNAWMHANDTTRSGRHLPAAAELTSAARHYVIALRSEEP